MIEIRIGKTKLRLHRPTWLEILAFILFLLVLCAVGIRLYR